MEDGCGIVADDIVAHEITHGVTQYESNLIYLNQSGAINESFSDIWGEFVDLTNGKGTDTSEVRWKCGEDITGLGAIRDLKDPTVFKHPDRITSSFYYCGLWDNGGVHYNSGVGNKAAYLMTDGDTFNGYTVKGLGYAKVADLFYEVQTNLLTSSASYADLYDALILACGNLKYSEDDCLQVKNALNAVEMNILPCYHYISETNAIFDGFGGTGSITVTATSDSNWTAKSNDTWITITSGNKGTGNGTVKYSVDPLSGTDTRTGTITITGMTFTVTQVEHKVISFPDINLETVVRQAIGKTAGDILLSDVWRLKTLNGNVKGIKNLEGLQYCSNLISLLLHMNQINSLTPIANLKNLTTLSLGINQISDITLIANLSNLKRLYLSGNKINDITAVAGLTNLNYIALYGNQISDIKPLVDNNGINTGDTVYLDDFLGSSNPLNTTSCTVYIPALQSRGVRVMYDCPVCNYSISPSEKLFDISGGGGSISVNAPNHCNWTAISNDSWIKSGTNGYGSGTVYYSVTSNSGTGERTGTIKIADKIFTITQSGVCTYSISPSSQSFSGNAGTGSVSVTALNGCNWTASVNANWISITSGNTGNGNGTVNYSVSSNTDAITRTGTLTIADKTFTVTQKGVPCTYKISPESISFEDSESHTGIFVEVTAPKGCNWSVTNNNTDWIETIITADKVYYAVASNPDAVERTGTLTIADKIFTVKQSGVPCTYKLSPEEKSFESTGGAGNSVIVNAPAGCNWTAVSNATWITLTGGNTGNGSGTVIYTVASNPYTTERTGTLTIGERTFKVIQAGIACVYSISPENQSFSEKAGAGSVSVTAPDGCGWTAAKDTDATWITIKSGSSGTGKGTVTYSVASNPDATIRTANLTIAGRTFTITQTGLPCVYTISPDARSFDATGGTGSVSVTALNGCNWTAASDKTWITVTSGISGNGNGIVEYSVSANPDAITRTGTLKIAEKTFTVTQIAECPGVYTVSPLETSFESNGGTGSVSVKTTDNCNWTVSSNAGWISITSGNTGSGNGAVNYSVLSNPDSTIRTGSLTIANKTVTITQKGAVCTYTVSLTEKSFNSNGGSGSVSVTAPGGCAWSVSGNPSWIKITVGNGKFDYSVDPNPDAITRTAILKIEDKTFTVTQTGVDCVYTISPSEWTFDSNGGTGSVSVTVPNGCAWSVSEIPIWIAITAGASGNGNGTVSYSVAPNPDAITRTANLKIADKTFTVTQTGITVCTYSFTTSQTVNDQAGTYNVSVSAANGCNWSAKSNNPEWITIKSGASGNGSGTVEYSVSANPDATIRTGTLTIAEKTFTVTQNGVGCVYTISPVEKSFDSNGGTGSISVTAPNGCTWSVSGVPIWITITAGASGNGSGTVAYSVSAKTDAGDRTGNLTIAGKTFTVTQTGIICTYSISPTGNSFNSDGGTGNVSITSQSGCNWIAVSNANWITVTSGNNGGGSGTVNYSVSQNTGTGERTGTIAIAGRTFTVVQSGIICTYSISPAGNSFDSAGGTGSVSVAAPNGCNWYVTNNAPWWITSTFSNGTVTYSVSSNTLTDSRTGTLTIAGQIFTVTQSGCSSYITPLNNSFDASGGTGNVSVTALNGCNWTAISNVNWISVTSGIFGNGNGTVAYSVLSNSDSATRTGILTVGGNTFTVTQAGCSVVYFPDKNLETKIRQVINRFVGNICVSDLLRLTELDAVGNGITNLEGIQHCSNLVKLYLSSNQIDNISTLVNLKKLTILDISYNKISDISPVSGLTNLTELRLNMNKITDVHPLAGLTNLTILDLNNNRPLLISDMTPLFGLTNLTQLDIGATQLGDGNVCDISPLAGLTKNLTLLGLYGNEIKDISPLATFTNLEVLWLSFNEISDISQLAGLINMTELCLHKNYINDISPLAGLINLKGLTLYGNNISDIKPLVDNSGIDSGDIVRFSWYDYWGYSNPLSTTSCTVYIPQLQSRGVAVEHKCP